MNLALAQPRSPRATIGGLAMAARTADKARGASAGTLGNFKYDCSMDNKLFAFAGIDASEYLAAVTSSADDSRGFAGEKNRRQVRRRSGRLQPGHP